MFRRNDYRRCGGGKIIVLALAALETGAFRVHYEGESFKHVLYTTDKIQMNQGLLHDPKKP